jgi:DNA-binding winged helix-turn-helix (wHTH) protein/Tol biopolymer transport system component
VEEVPRSVAFHPARRPIVRFAGFRADLSDMSLWRDGEEIRLPPRALGVLFFLLERPGRVVSKAALLDAVWKDANVTESSLIEAIGILRQTLGDDAQSPRIVQTIHRRGYRLVAPISVEPSPTELDIVRPPVSATPPGPIPAGAAAGRRAFPKPYWAAAIALTGVASALGTWLWRSAAEPNRNIARVTITLPPEQAPAPALNANPVAALSPDGQRLVYVAGSTGQYRLFSRRLDEFHAQPLPGTDGGHGPFFSPDGRHVGFFSRGRLMRTGLAGDEPLLVTAAAGAGLGGTWTPDGRIVFARGTFDGLWDVSAGGGTPRLLAAPPDPASGYRWPHALPDGGVVATRWRSNARDAAVVLFSPSAGMVTELAAPATDGRIIDGRTLVFVSGGTLMAAPFSGTAIEPPRAVLDRVMVAATGAAQFTTSATGDLLYIPDDPERTQRTVVLADRTGTISPTPLPSRAYQNLAVCGSLLAATILEHGVSDLWLGDLSRGTLTRLTDAGMNVEPVWRPGCQTILFGSSREGVVNIYEAAASGEAVRRVHRSDRVQVPTSIAPDGRLFLTEVAPATRADIWRLDPGGRAHALFTSPAVETAARISPDGRWLAYQVDDRNGSQVFVTAVSGSGSRVPVSTGSAFAPSWSSDGRRLYWRQGGTEVMQSKSRARPRRSSGRWPPCSGIPISRGSRRPQTGWSSCSA